MQRGKSVDHSIPQPHCSRCKGDCAPDGPLHVPFAMDVWENDVPILGVKAGDPVAFCKPLCVDCARNVA